MIALFRHKHHILTRRMEVVCSSMTTRKQRIPICERSLVGAIFVRDEDIEIGIVCYADISQFVSLPVPSNSARPISDERRPFNSSYSV